MAKKRRVGKSRSKKHTKVVPAHMLGKVSRKRGHKKA